MNKIQTILLSTGILLTTVSATVVSHSLTNNGPLPVESQRDTGEVELVRTPVVSSIVEIDNGYGGTAKVDCTNNEVFDPETNQYLTRSEGVEIHGDLVSGIFDYLYNKACN